MGRFLVVKRKILLKLTAAFSLGLIIGMVFATINMGHTIDQLTIDKENLKNELAGVKKELKQIKENLEERKITAVNSIEAEVTFPEDIFNKYEGTSLQMELEKEVCEMLQSLNGKNIDRLDPDLIPQIIEGRHITVENRSFQLHVETAVISQQLKIYVLAKPKKITENKTTF
ncbi:hypothetical protein MFMK1_003193 [Metallumcola ferriviriculae]|uniref:Sporulation membrane protein YtrI C-terminal domain-containing protein n=1 Tax=Metallumcola ferriviriculae TaxID=3039180 RepID=A0AAU0UQF5_9FIRM|nr:hypothetical protein MFMK1_003193 [Desulfitibacteraceae bacterium MK1]